MYVEISPSLVVLHSYSIFGLFFESAIASRFNHFTSLYENISFVVVSALWIMFSLVPSEKVHREYLFSKRKPPAQ